MENGYIFSRIKWKKKMIGDAYHFPKITEILDQLGSAKYISIFNFAWEFYQLPMHEFHRQKAAFSTPYGQYQLTDTIRIKERIRHVTRIRYYQDYKVDQNALSLVLVSSCNEKLRQDDL